MWLLNEKVALCLVWDQGAMVHRHSNSDKLALLLWGWKLQITSKYYSGTTLTCYILTNLNIYLQGIFADVQCPWTKNLNLKLVCNWDKETNSFFRGPKNEGLCIFIGSHIIHAKHWGKIKLHICNTFEMYIAVSLCSHLRPH